MPLDEVLKDNKLSNEQKDRLIAAREAKNFAEKNLGLKSNGNYESFVSLDRDAVTYVVQVAFANELKSYKWRFPLVGALPYKGYFDKKRAEDEAARFHPDQYDTWVRGVRAYSTLGWFRDPLTSPMLAYSENDLVEIILHELTHTTLYIKSEAEFNERLATFIGVEGAKLFYHQKEGVDSPTVKRIEDEQKDLIKFSEFISKELKELREWYQKTSPDNIQRLKADRIAQIQKKFVDHLSPKLTTKIFSQFPTQKLNNAILLSFETYVSDLTDFEDLYQKLGKDLPRFIQAVRSLENSKQPDADLRALTDSI